MDQIKTLLPKFKAAADAPAPNVEAATATLTELKKAVVSLRLALVTPEAIAAADSALAAQAASVRDIFETASYFSAKTGDAAGFERHFAQLKPFYTTFAPLLPSSPHRLPLTGLYLLHLVSAQPARLAEFHSELEQLPTADLKDTHIAYGFELERALMEGAYTRALGLRASLPLPAHGELFFRHLEGSVRTKIADCIEVAYRTYPTARLPTVLSLPQAGVSAFIAERGWAVDGANVVFARGDEDAVDAATATQRDVQTLVGIATQIERIV
jgi:26S proteasome regulatory subunit N12